MARRDQKKAQKRALLKRGVSKAVLLIGGVMLGAAAPLAAHATDFSVNDADEFEAALDAIALDPNSDHSITIAGDVDLTGFSTPVTGAGTISILSGGGVLTGAGGLVKEGAGGLTLSGTNTNTGDAQFVAGTVRLENDASLGLGGALTTGSVTIEYADGVSIANAIVLNSDPVLNVSVGSATQAGDISRLFGLGSNDGITKTGAGTLTLSGNNELNDLTLVSEGTLRLVGGLAIGDSGQLSVAAGATVVLEDSEIVGSFSGAGNIELGDNLLSYFSAANQTFSGVISGVGGSLRKSGNGVLTLTGANTYDGGTLLTGTSGLVLGNSNALGTGALTSIGSNAPLTYVSGVVIGNAIDIQSNLILTVTSGAAVQGGAISGNAIIKAGAGTLTLAGFNTYTGATTINAGMVAVTNGNGIGDQSAVTIAAGAALSLQHPFVFNGDETIGSLAGAGNVLLGEHFLIAGGNNASTTFSGVISGTGGLIKDGAGTLTLTGANTYTGLTAVSGGTLALSGGDAIADTSAVSVGGGATLRLLDDETIIGLGGVGVVDLGDNTLTIVSPFSGPGGYNGSIIGTGGLTMDGVGSQVLLGTNTYSGATTIAHGALVLENGAALSDQSAVTIAGGASLVLNDLETIGSLAGAGTANLGVQRLTVGGDNSTTTFFGVITGAGPSGGVTKIGSGTLTLAGANTNIGPVNINAGTLAVSGGAAISDLAGVNIAAGATFAVTTDETVGAVGGAGNIVLTGTLAAGGTSVTFLSGAISGVGGFTKNANGRINISGTNTYSGATAINAGVIAVSGGEAIGNLSAVTVASGATLEVLASETIGSLAGGGNVQVANNQTLIAGANNTSTEFFGVISGQDFEKVGSGVMTLSGVNAYLGDTQISGGVLALSGGIAISDASDVTIATGAALTLNANETVGSIAGAGNVNLGVNRLTAGGGGAITFSGAMSGAGGFTYAGSGTLTLAGANTYTGDTIISQGTLAIFNGQAIGDASNVFIAEGARLSMTNASEVLASMQGLGRVALNDNVLMVGANNSDFTFGGVIEGGALGGFNKVGSGNMTLTGANTYEGWTFVHEGTLTLSGGQALSDLSEVTVDRDASLVLVSSEVIGGLQDEGSVDLGANTLTVGGNNQVSVFLGDISGDGGSIIKTGTSVMQLGGANTHTGATIVNSGTLAVVGGSALPDTGLLTVASGATLDINSSETVGAISGAGAINVLGVQSLTAGGASNSHFSGIISGTGGFIKAGAGTLTLSGSNTYSGGTVIDSGALQVGDGGSSGVIVGGVVNNAILAFSRSNDLAFAGDISGTGALWQLGAGRLTLTGANTYSGGTVLRAGTLRAGLNGIGTGALTMDAGAVFELNSASDGVFAPDVAGDPTSRFAQIGAGAITYNGGAFGDFDVLAGAANINGTITVAGANGMTVAPGATLGGTGLIVGDLHNGGLVSPGNSIGTLVIDGNYVHAADATLRIELDASPANDVLSVTGDVTLLGGTIEFVTLGGGDGAAVDFLRWGGVLTGAFDNVVTNGGGAVAISYGGASTGGRYYDEGYVAAIGPGVGLIARNVAAGSAVTSQSSASRGGSASAAPMVLTARPSTPNAQASMLRRTTSSFLDTVFSELQREESAVWGRGFSDDMTRLAVGDSRGFQYSATGAIQGVHRIARNGASFGYALGAAQDETLLDERAGRNKGEAVFGAAYLGWQGDENFAAAGAAISMQRIDVSRVVQEAGASFNTLEGETDGRSFALFGSAGRRFRVLDWTFIASGELAYLATSTSGYEEVSLSAARVAFGEYETQSVSASLGLFAERSLRVGGMPLQARLGARASQENALDDRAIEVAFLAAGDFAILQGDESGRSVLQGVAGLRLQATDTLELSGDVLLASGDEERSAVSVGARWQF